MTGLEAQEKRIERIEANKQWYFDRGINVDALIAGEKRMYDDMMATKFFNSSD